MYYFRSIGFCIQNGCDQAAKAEDEQPDDRLGTGRAQERQPWGDGHKADTKRRQKLK